MPVRIKGETFYRTSEACQLVGIGRSTFLRWLRKGSLNDASYRDKRGWRLFTEADVERIAREANHVS